MSNEINLQLSQINAVDIPSFKQIGANALDVAESYIV